jgi:hypothetical protein
MDNKLTFRILMTLLRGKLVKDGVASFLVLSGDMLDEVLEDPCFKDIQNTNRHVGVSDSWQDIFTLYGLPKTLVIEAKGCVEFLSDE